MRISGGELKGRKIGSQRAFKGNIGDGLRPTSAKVREAIFDILRKYVNGSFFLDLYAGTGTVGFEALSRGAATAVLVENNPVRFQEISQNINSIGLRGRAHAYREQALSFLVKAASSGMGFDIIFADPPYSSDDLEKLLSFIDQNNVLKAGGCLMVEHSSRTAPKYQGRSLRLVKTYRYGDTTLTLYNKES